MDALALSRRCDNHARRDAERSRTIVDVGPFRALLDPRTDLIWLNYALPVAPLGNLDEAAAALRELERVFAAHRRTLRFEFNALLWPALPAALERYGLQLQAEHPLMVCTPATFTPVAAPEVTAWLLDAESPDAEISSASAIQRLSFGGEDRVTSAEEVAELRSTLRAGLFIYGLAMHEIIPAGVASLSPIDDVAELMGVATHPAARRRSVAATLSSLLVRTHFAQGGRLVWLSAGDAVAQATYAKLGFQLIDTRLNYLAVAS